jgi:hypothetical protein
MCFGQAETGRIWTTPLKKQLGYTNVYWTFGLQDTSNVGRQSVIWATLFGASASIIHLSSHEPTVASPCFERPYICALQDILFATKLFTISLEHYSSSTLTYWETTMRLRSPSP